MNFVSGIALVRCCRLQGCVPFIRAIPFLLLLQGLLFEGLEMSLDRRDFPTSAI
jgi:hypothetical protein